MKITISWPRPTACPKISELRDIIAEKFEITSSNFSTFQRHLNNIIELMEANKKESKDSDINFTQDATQTEEGEEKNKKRRKNNFKQDKLSNAAQKIFEEIRDVFVFMFEEPDRLKDYRVPFFFIDKRKIKFNCYFFDS